MSRDISELLPDVLVSASGCPPMIALQQLSSAVREFLYDTNAWKAWVPAVDTVIDQATYNFPNHLMDAAQRWARTKDIDILRWAPTGREIEFRTQQELQSRDIEWRSRKASVPSFYTNEAADSPWGYTIRLYPTPNVVVVGALSARLILSTHTYSGLGVTAYDAQPVLLADDVFERYRDAFVTGALARLYKMPSRDWSNPVVARERANEFNDRKVAAKTESDMDFGSQLLTVAYGGL